MKMNLLSKLVWYNVILLILIIGSGCEDQKIEIIEDVPPPVLKSASSDKVKVLTYNLAMGATRVFSGCGCEWSPDKDQIGYGDFNGDGTTDVFSVYNGQWRYLPNAENGWQDLNASSKPFSELRFGDFDGDGKTDVFTISGNQWKYSSGGISSWINLNSASVPVSNLRFGDFDGDGKTDLFTSANGQWEYSSGGISSWINLNASSAPLNDLRFEDFDGDGKTDILTLRKGHYAYSSGGVSSWVNLNAATIPLSDLRFGDFDGDGKTDIFASDNGQWQYLSGGVGTWMPLNFSTKPVSNYSFHDFNGDGKTDILYISGTTWKVSWGGVRKWTVLPEEHRIPCADNAANVKQLINKEYAIDLLGETIANEFSDGSSGILCFQEVNIDYRGKNILEEFVSKLGPGWSYEFHSPLGNSYGIAIVSNVNYTKTQVWSLPLVEDFEPRGAIALKFNNGNKSAWVVNTHLGLSEADQQAQVSEIIDNFKNFDPNTAILLAGDFNILDVHVHGSAITPTAWEIDHYANTIEAISDSSGVGVVSKLQYDSMETRPYSFHSWNSVSYGRVLDYMFLKIPGVGPYPAIKTFGRIKFTATPSNSLCSNINATNRYLSDHNGMILEYELFNY